MFDEILVGVLGVTGSGKSSFIKRLTKRGDILVGSGLSSTTTKVESYPFTSPDGKRFRLVDTPGLDDTVRDDSDILEALANWLDASYRTGTKFHGLLYLHRIIDNRETGTDLKNLRMFKCICGSENFSHVVLGTTFWDKESTSTAEARERLLRDREDYWGDLVKGGASIVRVHRDGSQDLDILRRLARQDQTVLRLQRELAGGSTVEDTEAFMQIGYAAQIRAIIDEKKLSVDAQLELSKEALRQKEESQRFASDSARQRYRLQTEEKEKQLDAEAERKKAQLDEDAARIKEQKQKNLADKRQQKIEIEELRKSIVKERIGLWTVLSATGILLAGAAAAYFNKDRE